MFGFLSQYTSPLKLMRMGIMGMNQRNVNYIGRYNKRKLYPLVDNKLLTKKMALAHHVNTPNLVGSVRNQVDAQNIVEIIGDKTEFCIKPAQGSGGKGILVITGREGKHFVKASGQIINAHDLRRHVSNILAGLFSLGGKPDFALIEDLIHFDPCFEGYSYEGVPDTRVIVFQGFPVMCMMRLSTAASENQSCGFLDVPGGIVPFCDKVLGIHQKELRLAFEFKCACNHEVLRFFLEHHCGILKH